MVRIIFRLVDVDISTAQLCYDLTVAVAKNLAASCRINTTEIETLSVWGAASPSILIHTELHLLLTLLYCPEQVQPLDRLPFRLSVSQCHHSWK